MAPSHTFLLAVLLYETYESQFLQSVLWPVLNREIVINAYRNRIDCFDASGQMEFAVDKIPRKDYLSKMSFPELLFMDRVELFRTCVP